MPLFFPPLLIRSSYNTLNPRPADPRTLHAEIQASRAHQAAHYYADAYEDERERRQHAQGRSLRAATAGYRQGYRHG